MLGLNPVECEFEPTSSGSNGWLDTITLTGLHIIEPKKYQLLYICITSQQAKIIIVIFCDFLIDISLAADNAIIINVTQFLWTL